MITKIEKVSGTFWYRLFIVFFAIFGGYLGVKFLPITDFLDDKLVFCGVAVLSVVAWLVVSKVVNNSLWTYLIAQLMLFWLVLDQVLSKTAHVSFKPHALVFGFMILAGIIYFFKNFKFLYKFVVFRLLLLFFIINIIYIFFYNTDFNIMAVHIKGVPFSSEDASAKSIMFLDSLSVFLSCIVPLSLFANIELKSSIDKIIYNTGKVFTYCFITFAILIPFIIDKDGLPGIHIYLPMYFFMLLAFKLYFDNCIEKVYWNPKLSNLMGVTCLVLLLTSLKFTNKTGLISLIAGLLLFILLSLKIKTKLYLPEFLKNKKLGIIISSLFLAIFIFIAIKLDILTIITNKMNTIFTSVEGSGITSYSIRKSNWHLFNNYWISNLDFLKFIFGFGLGKSRETIYFLSSAQPSSIYQVQTTHSHYMEMFFDYGSVALLYFLPIILAVYNNLIDITSRIKKNEIKLLSCLSLCLILFFVIYHYTDGLRVPTAIIFFSALFFIEGIKYSLNKVD